MKRTALLILALGLGCKSQASIESSFTAGSPCANASASDDDSTLRKVEAMLEHMQELSDNAQPHHCQPPPVQTVYYVYQPPEPVVYYYYPVSEPVTLYYEVR